MGAGVPIAISSTMDLAPLVDRLDLGLVLPPAAEAAARMISDVLNNPDKLSKWSSNARRYALENFGAKRISDKYVEFYQQGISLNRA